MSYQVLARKYRPQNLSHLVGQQHIAQTLAGAFKQKKLGQAYLFTGTRGVGKTSAARIFAKALRCINNGPESAKYGDPCNACLSCEEIQSGNSIDVLEIDGASNNGVDNVREIRENVKFLPSSGKLKVYIIDEVHMLTNQAFNALLKTLEEPPAHVTFILATTEVHKVPQTILSRCQRFDFKRVPQLTIEDFLASLLKKEKLKAEQEALRLIARKADGSMRDALSLMDTVLALGGNNITLALASEALGFVDRKTLNNIVFKTLNANILEALQLVQETADNGVDPKLLAVELGESLRNALFVKIGAEEALPNVASEEVAEIKSALNSVAPENLQAAFQIIMNTINEINRSSLPKAILEVALIRIARLGPMASVGEILSKLDQLGAGGGIVKSSAQAPLAQAIPTQKRTQSGPIDTNPDWRKFVNFVISNKANVGSLLEHATPITPLAQWKESKLIRIGFKDGQNFYFEQAKTPTMVKNMQELLSSYLGKAHDLKIESISPVQANKVQTNSIREAEIKTKQQKVDELKEKILESSVVQNTSEIFGAKLVSINSNGDSTKS